MIDGYNVVFARRDPGAGEPDSRELERERDALVSMLHHFLEGQAGRAIVVFDAEHERTLGRAPQRPHDRVEVIFSNPGGKADDTIIGIVQHARNPASITVVSSDLDVARAVGKLGAACQSSTEFIRAIERARRSPKDRTDAEPPEKREGLSAEEVNYWLKMFGNPPDPTI